MQVGEKQVGTINLTPKWKRLFPIYAEWIDSGIPTQKQLVKDEFWKLCKLADEVNEEREKQKKGN